MHLFSLSGSSSRFRLGFGLVRVMKVCIISSPLPSSNLSFISTFSTLKGSWFSSKNKSRLTKAISWLFISILYCL
ncbi:hypothetical protein LguiB_004228 [Lonicera macranthoides]